MMSSRILLLVACCAFMPSAWAGAGLTSAGVDTSGNNNAQNEPTLAQVAPVANQGQPGTISAGANAAAPNPATAAGAQAGAGGPHAATGAADGSKPAVATVVAPAPPPPPPDPSTLPVSVIRPLNKAAENAAPKADAVSTVTAAAQPIRHPPAEGPTEAAAAPPPPAPARAPQPPPPRVEPTARTAGDVAAAITTPTSATADGSANGYVFYTGMGIAGIILALSFVGYMRAGNDSGRPRA